MGARFDIEIQPVIHPLIAFLGALLILAAVSYVVHLVILWRKKSHDDEVAALRKPVVAQAALPMAAPTALAAQKASAPLKENRVASPIVLRAPDDDVVTVDSSSQPRAPDDDSASAPGTAHSAPGAGAKPVDDAPLGSGLD